jgi:hypothetical protein
MDPYRRVAPTKDEPRSREELVIAFATLALGLLGVAIGLVFGRPTEAGLGVAITVLGAYAARALIRR